MRDVLIVGGGPAGLTSAIICARQGKKVTIVERNNKCGKKLLITGNGRCNFWNDDQDLNHYHSFNNDLIDKFITLERKEKVLDFFDSLGIVYKVKNGYYYPITNQASTILNILLLECQKLGVEIIYDTLVDEIIKKECFIINPNKENIKAKKVILTVGSKAMSKTGSDGLGFEIVKSFGHTVTQVLPSLVQLEGNESYFKKWSGVRALGKVSLYIDDKFIKSEDGEVQFTDYGISGICIFNLSRYASLALDNKDVYISINFMNWIDDGMKWLYDYNKRVMHRNIKELLEGFLNYKLVDIVLKKANINGNILIDNLSFKEMDRLISNLTDFRVKINKTHGFEHAQVCMGGVPLDEINPSTFESLKVKGLYFAGEFIDIDGDCGGYNLGFAWMSGLVCGSVK